MAADYSNEQNKIAKGTTMTGDVVSQGCFRIDGVLKGTLKTKGKIVIGQSGVVEGEVTCADADIEGKLVGMLKVDGKLLMKATAVIEGDVVVGKLSVEPGASLEGTCSMKGAVKTLENGKKQPTEKSA